MTRRTLFASLIGAPVAAALGITKGPDVIDWSASKPIVGDLTIPLDFVGYNAPINTTYCTAFEQGTHTVAWFLDGVALDENGHKILMEAADTFNSKHLNWWVNASKV